jgi:hypothetical protein
MIGTQQMPSSADNSAKRWDQQPGLRRCDSANVVRIHAADPSREQGRASARLGTTGR